MNCPKCGSANVDRDAVDIGVGTQYGPWGCFDCEWVEGVTIDDVMIDTLGALPDDAPPAHPNCRCLTADDFGKDEK